MKVRDLKLVLDTQDDDADVVLKTSSVLLPNATYTVHVNPEYRDEKDSRVQVYPVRRVY